MTQFLPPCESLAIFSFVCLHALIWCFTVNSRFSAFRSAFGRIVTLLSFLAICEVTLYRNVPWPVCVGPICRSILSGIHVLSLTGVSACRVVICENGFPPFRLFQYPDMIVIPVLPAYPGWVWPCSSSLRVRVGVPCDTWRWSVPILPWFVCAAKKNVRLESIVFFVILAVIVFLQQCSNLASFHGPTALRSNWPCLGSVSPLSIAWLCSRIIARCLSSNDLHCDVILSQSRQFSQRWFVVYPCFWISCSILRSLSSNEIHIISSPSNQVPATLCLLNGCSRFSNLLCLFRQILLTMCYFCLQLTLSPSVMTLFTAPHSSYILFQRPSSDHLVCYVSWYCSWQLW